jgi:hypothetical protein
MNVPCRSCGLLLGCAVSFAALSACSDPITGGQTGDGSEVLGPSAPTPNLDIQISQAADCKGVARRLDALDSDTPLGFTAADILAFAEGSFATDIGWLPASDAAGFGFAPETTNGLSLSVAAGDDAFIVEPEEVDGGVPEGCAPYLVVPVTVSVESEGGALNETFDTELLASTLELATFAHSVPAATLEGSLELVDAPPGVALASVVIAGTVSELGTLGRVSVTTTGADDEILNSDGEATAVETLAARWPAAVCAGTELGYNEPGIVVASDQTVGQLDLAEALAQLRGRSPIALRWQADDGSEISASTLSAEFELGNEACALESGGRFALAAPVQVHLASADGKLEADVGGRFDAQPGLDGALGWTSVSVNFEASAAEFAEQVRLNGVNVDGYDRISFWLNLSLETTSDQLSGSLSISGQESTACVAAPEPEALVSCPVPVLGAGIGPIYKP